MSLEKIKITHDLLVSYNPKEGKMSRDMVQKIEALFPNATQCKTSKELIKHYLELHNWDNTEAVEELIEVYIHEKPILDLSRLKKKISSLPATIRYLAPHLKTLNVSNQSLTSLPKEIEELKALRVLRASKNQLKHLPKIAKLDLLEELDVSHNQLQELPEPLFRTFDEAAKDGVLVFRESLSVNFSYNSLTKLPSDLFRNQYMKSFNVESNKLTPDAIPEDPDWPILEYFNAK